MTRFRLLLACEDRGLEEGFEALLRADVGSLAPPDQWAEDLVLVDSISDDPDAALLVLNGPPSATLREVFFKSFRDGIPICALSRGSCSHGGPVFSKLRQWDLCFEFDSVLEARRRLANEVQQWIRTVRRESFGFPSGDELLNSYGDIDPSTVDEQSKIAAESVLSKRGFVCISGELGSGKTTLARLLMLDSHTEGLKPVEVISPDVNGRDIERILTGAEDCIAFVDLDIFRRELEYLSMHILELFVSLIIRATESRRRCILASSMPEMVEVFDSYGDGHVRLPRPSGTRQWRLEEGRRALQRYSSMNEIDRAELLLLVMFEPVVPEALFRGVLFDYWDRLLLFYENRLPDEEEKEGLYRASLAYKGETPFRRFGLRGESHIAAGDTMRMNALDDLLNELLLRRDPSAHVLADTLLGSGNPRVRRAGYNLCNFYHSLSQENRTSLLQRVSKEGSFASNTVVLMVLLSKKYYSERPIRALCRRLLVSDSKEARRALAFELVKPWVVSDSEYGKMVDDLLEDDPEVRSSLMNGIYSWSKRDVQDRLYLRLLEDDDPQVRGLVLDFVGSRFPVVTDRETELINEALIEGDSQLLMRLANGLLNRLPEEFSEEFTDLLWLLLERLEPQYKAQFSMQVGGRLRYFAPSVRKALLTNLEEGDVRAAALCLLMNYSWLSDEEREKFWSIAMNESAGNADLSNLVLRYFSTLEKDGRELLVRKLLVSEAYGGREALTQMLAKGKEDLAEICLGACGEIIGSGAPEERARIPWFILWNLDNLDRESGVSLLQRLGEDGSEIVRIALARAVLRLGCNSRLCMRILEGLATDGERSVRAAAGEALGELCRECDRDSLLVRGRLLEDEDAFVRVKTLQGAMDSVRLEEAMKKKLISKAVSDPSSDVRRSVIKGLAEHEELCDESMAAGIAQLLNDSDKRIRLDAVRLVTDCPALLSSDSIRERLPDLFLDRMSTGITIADELNTARQIQTELLPEFPPNPDPYEVDVVYRPAREVGGDYYDFFEPDERKLVLVVGDVAGKGIPAALTMAALKGNLSAWVWKESSIREIVRLVNESLCTVGEGENLAGLFYSVLNISNGEYSYVNAGHNPPLLVRPDGSVKRLTEGGLLLGFRSNAEYEDHKVYMSPGDVLVLYTDGITEVMDDKGEELGIEGLSSIVTSCRDLSAGQITARIMDRIGSLEEDSSRRDDQTLVVVKHR